MFFLQACRILAILALVFGGLKLVLGFTIATEALLPYEDGLKRYAPNAKSSGEVIDKGRDTVLFAFVLGALAEIGLAIVRKARDKGREGGA